MALVLVGLSSEDVAEVVECLVLGSDYTVVRSPVLSARRRELADSIGDALDALPVPSGGEVRS